MTSGKREPFPTAGKSDGEPLTATTTKRDASVPPGQGVSISEAVGKYFGNLPKVSDYAHSENLLQQRSQAPKPLVEEDEPEET